MCFKDFQYEFTMVMTYLSHLETTPWDELALKNHHWPKANLWPNSILLAKDST